MATKEEKKEVTVLKGAAAITQLIKMVKEAPFEGFCDTNREKQRNVLKKAVKNDTPPNPPSISDALIRAFQEVHPGVRPGRIVKIKPGARYGVTQPGSLVFVRMVPIPADAIYLELKDLEVQGYALTPEGRIGLEGNLLNFKIKDLETISAKEEVAILESWIRPEPKYPPLVDGDPVQLTEDTTRVLQSFWGTYTQKLPKGLAGVVDVPDLQSGWNVNDINQTRDDRPKISVEIFFYVMQNKSQLYNYKMDVPREGHGFMYNIYVPKFRQHIECHRSLLEKRPFRKDLWDSVIELPELTRKKILDCVFGTNDDALKGWGLTDHLTKGKGCILLLWGAPGTGKSMSAEALAEHLERPLYIVDSSILGTSLEDFEKGLKETIDRAKRWKAVVLWDEAEIYLKQRGDDTEQNQRVAAMLRHLENFEGILILTTNRPVELDFAIDSRIHLKAFFKQFDDDRRETVWRVTIPKTMPVHGLDEVMPALRAVDLNGREIKTAIWNAAKSAKAAQLDHVPGDYLLTEARDLYESSQLLRAAREKGDDWASSEQAIRSEVEAPQPLPPPPANGKPAKSAKA